MILSCQYELVDEGYIVQGVKIQHPRLLLGTLQWQTLLEAENYI